MQVCLCAAAEFSPLCCWGWSYSCKQTKPLPLVWGHLQCGDWAAMNDLTGSLVGQWAWRIDETSLHGGGFKDSNKEMPIWVMFEPYKMNGHEYNWAISYLKCDSPDNETFCGKSTLKERKPSVTCLHGLVDNAKITRWPWYHTDKGWNLV